MHIDRKQAILSVFGQFRAKVVDYYAPAILTQKCEQNMNKITVFWRRITIFARYHFYLMIKSAKRLLLLVVLLTAPCFIADMGANRSIKDLMVDDGVSLRSRFVEFSFSAFGYNTFSSGMMQFHFDGFADRPSVQINRRGTLSKGRMMSFLWNHNKRLDFLLIEQIVDLYLKESDYEGINHDIAFIQMCHETGFLKFTGDVGAHQHNYCGLGATGNGVAGLSFPSMEMGVRAHVPHLKAYASAETIKGTVVYDRIRFVKRGMSPSLHDLTGKWATDPLYGEKIERLLGNAFEGSFLTGFPVNRKTSFNALL
jgi:hypothetical protein